jgi:hypothetical protein
MENVHQDTGEENQDPENFLDKYGLLVRKSSWHYLLPSEKSLSHPGEDNKPLISPPSIPHLT